MRKDWSAAGSSGHHLRMVSFGSQLRSSAICSKALRNIPSAKADESFSEVIRVLDPRHPLYGRSFRVICPGRVPGFFYKSASR